MIFRLNSKYIKRSLPNTLHQVYLTFDDGPSNYSSPMVLDVLGQNQIQSTFFVVGENIKKNTEIAKKAMSNGHALLSHSLDHRYFYFFSSKRKLKNWILNSVHELQDFTGQSCWGFRPPAGIITPPLIEVAEEESLPIYLWNHRFFDTQKKWTPQKATKSAQSMKSGDIILLHDDQKRFHLDQFLHTLNYYIQNIKIRGLQPSTIRQD